MKIKRASHWLARLCLTLSGICLMALMSLTVLEVIGRYAFNAPIFGRQDIAQILLAASIFLAFPVVTLRGEQIDVDLLDPYFSEHGAFWRDRCIAVLTSGVLVTMAVWIFERAEKAHSRGITSEMLSIPKYPLLYCISGIVMAAGVLLAVSCVWSIATKFRKGCA